MADTFDTPVTCAEPPLRLDVVAPVAAGRRRDVFAHPEQARLLLKRERPRAGDGARSLMGRFRGRRPEGGNKGLVDEYRTYICVATLAERQDRPVPIAGFGPILRTEAGLAQVWNRVGDGRGGLARTLRSICRDGAFDTAMLARLNAFVADVYALNVVAPDLHDTNVVLDGDAASPRFVLVDGFGDKTLVPIRTWLPWLNARQLDRRFARLAGLPPLDWRPDARRFRLRPAQ